MSGGRRQDGSGGRGITQVGSKPLRRETWGYPPLPLLGLDAGGGTPLTAPVEKKKRCRADLAAPSCYFCNGNSGRMGYEEGEINLSLKPMLSAAPLQPSIFDQIQADEAEETAVVHQQAAQQNAALERLRLSAEQLKAIDHLAILTKITPAQIREAVQAAGGFTEFLRLPREAKKGLPYIGEKRAESIEAAIEFAKLIHLPDTAERLQIRSPADVANLLMLEMGLLEREQLRVIGLDTKNHVVNVETVYSGSLNTTVVRIAEVLRMAIINNCAGIILVHNHPSGDPTPSPEDVQVTELIKDAGEKLNIAVLDHMIFGRNRYVSLKERGLGL